jgi:hypothetical protein
MDTSGIRTLLVMLLLGGGVFYLWDRNKRAEEYTGTETELRTIEGNLVQRKSDIEFLTKKLEPLRNLAKEAEVKDAVKLEQEIGSLRDELATLNADWEAAIKSFETSVEEVRLNAKQQTFPEITLPSGEILKAASISKFGEGFVSIQHDGGVKRILANDLPDGWVKKYCLDYVPDSGNEALAGKVKEKTEEPLSPADLADAAKGKVDAIYEQEVKLSTEIRELQMEANRVTQEGFRAVINKGLTGDAAATARRAFFKKADGLRKSIEPKRAQYSKLREQRLAIEQEQIRKVNASKPQPQ